MKKVFNDGKEYWQQEEKDIPKIPMPFPKDMLKNNQPERSKREDSECDFCKGDCKCLLRQKNHLVITKSIKNEEIVHEGPITFTI